MPVLLLFIGSFTQTITFGPVSVTLIGGILLLADVTVYMFALRAFQREKILVSWK